MQFEKQIFITKKNNKPAVGIVPVEYVNLLIAFFNKAKESKDIADVMKDYIMFIEPEEFKQLQAMIKNPPKPMKRMLASARSSMKIFGEINAEDI